MKPVNLAETAAQQFMLFVSGSAASVGVFTHVDGWSLAAAFMGAVVYVLQSTEIAVWKRIIFLPVSVYIGYIAADDIMIHTGLSSRAVAAFITAAFTITVITKLLAAVRTYDIDLSSIFKRK